MQTFNGSYIKAMHTPVAPESRRSHLSDAGEFAAARDQLPQFCSNDFDYALCAAFSNSRRRQPWLGAPS